MAVFDLANEGGNADGRIGPEDAVFASLLLWRDIDHNGVSTADELSPFSASGIEHIDLDYRLTRRQDEHGNLLRYRSRADGDVHGRGRWVWDVIFQLLPR